jgi:hypothetical protein
MTRPKALTDRERGRRDGFDGCEPGGDTPDYRAGYVAGRQERQEAHERLSETCRRFARYATRRA